MSKPGENKKPEPLYQVKPKLRRCLKCRRYRLIANGNFVCDDCVRELSKVGVRR